MELDETKTYTDINADKLINKTAIGYAANNLHDLKKAVKECRSPLKLMGVLSEDLPRRFLMQDNSCYSFFYSICEDTLKPTHNKKYVTTTETLLRKSITDFEDYLSRFDLDEVSKTCITGRFIDTLYSFSAEIKKEQ